MEYNYTFRAELECDAIKLLSVKDFIFATWTFRRDGLIDFSSTLTIKQVRACMRQVPDGHRMRQTINHADKFDVDGEWYISEEDQ